MTTKADKFKRNNLKVENSCKFVRIKDDVKTIGRTETLQAEPDSKVLFTLNKTANGEYWIDTEKGDNTDKLWLVVRAMKTEMTKLSYELKKNDIIKLGRIQFRVRDMQTETIPKNDPKDFLCNEDVEEVGSVITDWNDSQEPGSSRLVYFSSRSNYFSVQQMELKASNIRQSSYVSNFCVKHIWKQS